MDSLTLELFRRLQSGPYDESGFKHIQRLLGSQRRVLRSKQDIATLTEIEELLEAWAISAEDPQLGAAVIAEAADIAERELRRPTLASELRALPAVDGGEEQQPPSAARCYAALGRSRLAAGYSGAAIEAFERALEIEAEPDFVRALADLYTQRGAEGDREQAADLYCTLGELLGIPDGIPMLKAALVQNPAHEEARKLLTEYVASAPGPLPTAGPARALTPLGGNPPRPPALRPSTPGGVPAPLSARQSSPGGLPAIDRLSSPDLVGNRPTSPGGRPAISRTGAPASSAARESSPGARISSPDFAGSARAATLDSSAERPAIDRTSSPDSSGDRPTSPGGRPPIDRISSPGLAANAQTSPSGTDRSSAAPEVAAQRQSSASGRPAIDRLSSPPGLAAQRPSSPGTQPYGRSSSTPGYAPLAQSAAGTESSFERQSSTHAIPDPRPIGRNPDQSLDRQSSTHVLTEQGPSNFEAIVAASEPPPLQSQTPSSLSGAPGRRASASKQHSTLSGGWKPPASGPSNIRAASLRARLDAVSGDAKSRRPPEGPPPLGAMRRAQAEALSDLLPGPEESGPSVLEINVSTQPAATTPASSLSPVIRDEPEPEAIEPVAVHKRKRLLRAGVALGSACIVWLALVLAPHSTDPASTPSPSAASSNVPASNARTEIGAPSEKVAPNSTGGAATTGTTDPRIPAPSATPDTSATPTPGNVATEAAQPKPAEPDTQAKPAETAKTETPETGAAKPELAAKTEPSGATDPATPDKTKGSDAKDKDSEPGPQVKAALELAALRGGKINETQLTAAIDKAIPKLDRCYEQALKQKPRLKGKLGLGWTIKTNGKLGTIKKLSGTIKDPQLLRCTVDALESTRFPKPRGKAADVRLGLEYQRP